MTNEHLLSPKDVEINRLKLLIEKFKKYDNERKQYYKDALQELGALKSYILELEETSPDISKNQLIEQIAKYKNLYEQEVLINNTIKNKDKLLPELTQLNFYKNKCAELDSVKEELSKAQKKVVELKKDVNRLIYENLKNKSK